jgi:hypothetical protein
LVACLAVAATGCSGIDEAPDAGLQPDAGATESCGNGAIDGTEACDGTDLNNKTCATEGFVSGTLTCDANCTLNTSTCVAAANCGNGAIDGNEACDGTNLDNKTCVTEGYGSGTLTCNASCTLNTSACVPVAGCGNAIIEGTEACDTTNMNYHTCATEGFGSGQLTCNSDCTLNTSACVAAAACGNGIVEGLETCDGTNLNQKTCVTQGFASGNLACTASCVLDTSACVAGADCGNGNIDGTEECDGTNLNQGTCVTQSFIDGALSCHANCTFNTSACETPAAGQPGGPCLTGDTCNDGYWACEDLIGVGKVCTQPCFRNENCPDGLRCEQFGATQADKFCVVGVRGLAVLGEPCGADGNDGCLSGVCWDADESVLVDTCTGDCFGHFDCTDTLPICWESVGMCGPITAGDVGGFCLAEDACSHAGACVDVPSVGKRCAVTCTAAGDNCIQDYLSCQDVGGQFYCLATPK